MKDRPKITKIEVHQFEFQLRDRELRRTAPCPIYKPGAVVSRSASAIKVFTNLGVTGEYVGGSASALPIFARLLIGRNALDREAIYNDVKPMGTSQVDIALWDLAGKFYEAPIYELLGAY